MRPVRAFVLRVVGTLTKRRSDRDFAEELESHVEMHTEANVRAGMEPDEARRAALVALGGIEQTKELLRDRRGLLSLESLVQDLRFAARSLRKAPGFAFVAIATLALGVGANTAVFSVMNAVLFRALPYPAADRLVTAGLSVPEYREVRDGSNVFETTAVYASNLYNLAGDGETTQVRGAIVSPEFFGLLGAATLGRTFGSDEDLDRLVVISDGLWRRRFGGDPSVLGRTIVLSGQAHTIVGVMPPQFAFPSSDFELWVPFGSAMAEAPEQVENRSLRIFKLVGRLRPGVSIVQAQADLDRLSADFEPHHAPASVGARIRLVSVYERLVGDVRPALYVLLAAVGLLLLIGCANVANLLLARNASRGRELAMRAALGAGRWRVARLLLSESVVIASVGGLIGVVVSVAILALFRRLGLDDLPRGEQIGVDLAGLAFALGATALTAAACGVAPVLQSARADIGDALKQGGRGHDGSPGQRVRSALVVVELALAVVVLVGAGLLVRSLTGMLGVDPGFVPERLLTMNLQLVDFKDPALRAAAAAAALERVGALPNVAVAGGGTGLPPQTPQRSTDFESEDRPDLEPDARSAFFVASSPAYFRALGTRVREGRAFDDRDTKSAPEVVVVSASLAERLYPNGGAVGRRLKLVGGDQDDAWRTIVGVVEDVRYTGLTDPDQPAIYTPFAQTPFSWMYLMVRTSGEPGAVAESVRRAIAADGTLTVASIRPMTELVSASVARPRFNTALISLVAVLGLLLAACGVYAVVSYSVAQRVRELGVRAALGATPRALLELVLGRGLALGFVGLALGTVGAAAVTRLMSSLLFGVTPGDPATYAAVAALLLGVVAAACLVPSLKAAKADPTIAMRGE